MLTAMVVLFAAATLCLMVAKAADGAKLDRLAGCFAVPFFLAVLGFVGTFCAFVVVSINSR